MAQGSQLTIHTDGASRGNPGPAAFAFVIVRDGQPPVEQAGRLANTTNNQAEYTALVRALECALQLGADHRVVVHSDSELMVKQMNGQYRVKDAGLRPLFEEAVRLKGQFRQLVKVVHVRREANRRADELCNLVLDGRMPSTLSAAPRDKPSRGDASIHQEAVARLTAAAAAWARGNPAHPAPDEVWRQLWTLVNEHGTWLPKPRQDDDSEE